MNSHIPPSEFRLPPGVHPRIGAFYAHWLDQGRGETPDSWKFDIAVLSADYPLLARIGLDASGKTLMWLEVASAVSWPFKTPVDNRPLIQSVPVPSIKRVVGAFKQTLTSGMPDYYETTSWSNGGRSISLARIVVPVKGDDGPELIAFWEVLDGPDAV